MFLSAFCHYQTHMMLEETRPLRRHRGAHIDEIVAESLLFEEQQPISDEVADYGSWSNYGVIDEKETEGQEGVPNEFSSSSNQAEGVIKTEENKVGSPSSPSNLGTNSTTSTSSSIKSPSSGGPAGEGMCPICMDKPQNAVCIPCGHTAGCYGCLLRTQREKHTCPICRARVKQVVKLHRV